MFASVVKQIRSNTVAWLALFVALGGTGAYAADTVGSSDIINESILSVDIKNGAVGNQDIAVNSVSSSRVLNESLLGNDVLNDSLTGADILESSLGKVNDADTLDGLNSTDIVGQNFTGTQEGASLSDLCTVPAQWAECGTFTVNVPANKIYRVVVDSAGSYNSAVANRVAICSSARPSSVAFDPTAPACVGGAVGVTVGAGEIKGSAANGAGSLSGGVSGETYVISTSVYPDAGLTFDISYDLATVVTVATILDVTNSPGALMSSKSQKLTRPGK